MAKKQKTEKEKLIESFIKEHIPVKELFKAGFFPKEIKGDYQAMADRICKHFGYETVFQYGAEEIRCHLTLAAKDDKFGLGTPTDRLTLTGGGVREEPFITVVKSIYED